jgi:hypothetical protein
MKCSIKLSGHREAVSISSLDSAGSWTQTSFREWERRLFESKILKGLAFRNWQWCIWDVQPFRRGSAMGLRRPLSYLNHGFRSGCQTQKICRFGSMRLMLSWKRQYENQFPF